MLNTNEKPDANFHLNSFLQKYSHDIYSLGVKTYKSTSDVALSAYKEQITIGLRSACNTFLSNPNNDISEINKYLYGSFRNINKNIINQDKKGTLICPGCKYFNHISFIVETSEGLSCINCNHSVYNNQDDSLNDFYNLFSNYDRQGYKCSGCLRFVPQTICKNNEFICPYPNCATLNTINNVKKSSHPTLKINAPALRSEAIYPPQYCQYEDQLTIKEEINNYYNIIVNCIDEQLKTLKNRCFPSTYMIKSSMYNAFKKYLQSNPEEMVPYLANLGRVSKMGKLQSRIFQVFIKELENNLPFTFTKRDEIVEVKSLLDPNLCIFDGESIFSTSVTENNKIPNMTKEIYTGGRGGRYKLPFYIGKLLDIKDIETGKSLMDKVIGYSCINITMGPEIIPGTNVEVKHLRIPAHYYTGGFTYLNRIKKSILTRVVEKIKEDAA